MDIELLRFLEVPNFLWTNLVMFGIYWTILICLKLFVMGAQKERQTFF